MGCAGSKDVKYEFEGKTRTIKNKKAIALNRWA